MDLTDLGSGTSINKNYLPFCKPSCQGIELGLLGQFFSAVQSVYQEKKQLISFHSFNHTHKLCVCVILN